jgi:hypothetical protein
MSRRGNGYGSENRVNILKKIKVGKSWTLYPAVVEPNGKLRDKVRVRGKVEIHPEGYYYIEWWQDGRKREQIKDRADVIDRARRKAIELEANRAGIETVQENGNGNGATVAEAVASYLKDIEPPQLGPKTYAAYKHCLELFANTCAKRYISDVKREDLLAFIRKLYELKCVSKHGNKCSEGAYCSNFFLHKFRHTFATQNLQDHVCDIKTLQNWMGHKDLASTMIYLKAVRNKDVMARVNSSELAALVA